MQYDRIAGMGGRGRAERASRVSFPRGLPVRASRAGFPCGRPIFCVPTAPVFRHGLPGVLPSAYAGVRSRLFRSFRSHPLVLGRPASTSRHSTLLPAEKPACKTTASLVWADGIDGIQCLLRRSTESPSAPTLFIGEDLASTEAPFRHEAADFPPR